MEWNGTNIREIVNAILDINPEVKLHVLNKKLILRDDDFEFNRAVLIGDIVKIPKRDIIEDDEFETEEQEININYETI